MDEYVDQPVWCVVNWDGGERKSMGDHIDSARRLRDLGPPLSDWRVARWDDGRWVEAPPPEPEMKAPRDPWALIYPEGDWWDSYLTLDKAAADVARWPERRLRIFRLVEHQDGKVPVMLDRGDAEWLAPVPFDDHRLTRLTTACRAALDAEDAS